MPLFALPFGTSNIPTSIRSHLTTRIANKRRRPSSPTDVESASEIPQPSTSLAFAATNPLSLTPDEVKQYRTAGLELDQELPSESLHDFPHRGLPPSFPGIFSRPGHDNGHDGDNDNDGAEATSSRSQELGNRYGQRRGPLLRMQHLAVLTAILHRCLSEGDIPRASRAWAMLLRTQVNGSDIDIRTSRYWGIGAELLVRGEELPGDGGRKQDSTGVESDVSGNELGDDGSEMVGNTMECEAKSRVVEQRWGSAAGLEKAKEYYERLILQHPYKRQFHNSVNALDFWPAMLGCEIYGIQFNLKEGLRRLDSKDDNSDAMPIDSYANESFSAEDDYDEAAADPDIFFLSQQHKETRRRARELEIMWQRRDKVRQTALAAAQAVAARMDDLMTSPPYSDSYALLRLRGMLALYVGDLSVPTASPEDDEEAESKATQEHGFEGSPPGVSDGSVSERRIQARQRRAEHERGLLKRRGEIARARDLFDKLRKKAGGRVDPDVTRLSAALEVDEEDGDSEWSERGYE